MSDIEKKLKIIATLDTSDIKKQLDDLRKQGKTGGLGTQAGNSESTAEIQNVKKIMDSFGSTLSELAKEFQKVLGSVKGMGKAPGVQPGVHDKPPSSDSVKEGIEVEKAKRAKAKEIFDAERGTYKKVADGEKYDTGSGKKFKKIEDFEQFKKIRDEKQAAKNRELDEKSQDKNVKADDVALEKKMRAEARSRELDEKNQQKLAKAEDVALAKRVKAELDAEKRLQDEAAKQEIKEQKKAEKEAKKTTEEEGEERPGLGSLMKRGLGAAGAVGGTVMGAAHIHRQITNYNNREALDILHDKELEGGVRQAGRGGLKGNLYGGGGAIAGALAGAAAGSMIGPWGTAAGAVLGGIKGFYSGKSLAGEQEVDAQATGLESFDKARGLIPSRLNALRGGGVDLNDLNNMQGVGAAFGFSPEQSLQQFGQAKSALGNKGAKEALPGLQLLSNSMGMEVGQSASTIETYMGSGGQSQSQGGQQLIDNLKKGVSLGFDASRVKDLIQTGNQYLQEQTGLAKLDTQTISDRLATLARGFAGEGGEITSTSLNQAAKQMDLERRQSSSTSGVSGIGNMIGIQDAAKNNNVNLSSATFSNLVNTSSNAKRDAFEKIVGAGGLDSQDPKVQQMITDIIASKKDNLGNGQRNLGLPDDWKLLTKTNEQGGNTEDAVGSDDARKIADNTKTSTDISLPMGKASGQQEFDRVVMESAKEQTTFIEGIKSIGVANKLLEDGIKTLASSIQKSAEELDKLKNNLRNTNTEIERRPQ